ncbi:MAG: hypothetical protein LKJ26_06755 [Lentilactobacillus buchneri]|nr:hypothetical protein [Lentilactobacillus buchneri]
MLGYELIKLLLTFVAIGLIFLGIYQIISPFFKEGFESGLVSLFFSFGTFELIHLKNVWWKKRKSERDE